jgi:transposase
LKVENIQVDKTLERVRKQIEEEKDLSPALRASLELLLTVVTLLLSRLGLNSQNSSKPPASDHNRKKKKLPASGNRAGGQKGHTGKYLALEKDPDQIKEIKVDRTALSKGRVFQSVGYEQRQVFDVEISRIITEYRAEIMEDEQGRRVVAPFPDHVKVKTQYGASVKVHAVYMSNYQLLPYKRIEEHFSDQFGLPLSSGSIYNFNKEIYNKLAPFEDWIKRELTGAQLLHADETGINISGKRHWLHVACNKTLTWLMLHSKRGGKAIEAMGVLPNFSGRLVHDHWKPYYTLSCEHVLCNAHHIRELERAWEQDVLRFMVEEEVPFVVV